MGVKKEDCFESILEKEANLIKKTEIINFGTGNYNTEQEVNLFLKKGLKYKPDHVVVFYFLNDAEVTPKKSKWNFLSYSRSFSFVWLRLRSLNLNSAKRKSFKEYYSNLYNEDQQGWLNTKSAFQELKKECLESNTKLQVILLPELHNLEEYIFIDEHQKVMSFLKKEGIDCLDLSPFFSQVKNPFELWVAPDDAHPNDKAHKMIAEYSINFIFGEKND